MHPSWVAKQKMKEMQAQVGASAAGKAKKIVFD